MTKQKKKPYTLNDFLEEENIAEQANAVAIKQMIHTELSTQEAADILNVSHSFFLGLLGRGIIPCHKVGTHRRVLAKDVIEYKQAIDAKRMESLDNLSSESQTLGMGYDE